MKLGKVLAALGLAAFAAASPGFASNTPVPFFSGSGGPNPIGLPGVLPDMNNLISQINAILTPLQPNVLGAVNFPSLSPGVSGTGITLAPYGAAGDANVSVKIEPKGNGSVIMFSSVANINSTGLIKVGNLASWVPIQGIAGCPGVPSNRAPIGMSDHIRGYLMVKDYLDRTYGMPAC